MSAVEPGSTGREHGASGGGIGDGSDRSHAIRHWGRLGGIGAALGMSIVFAVAAWYALERSDMQDEAAAEIPLIKADTGEMKEKPKDPGGLKIPNQDKLVFERITPKPVAPAAGKLAPAPEEPIVKAPSTENLETPAAPVIANKTQMEEVVAPPAPVKAMKQPEAPAAVATHAASPTPPAPPAIANKAKIKAAKDAEEKSRTGWIVGSTLASLVLSPLLGGLGSVAIAYNTGGETSIPTSDMMQLQSEYGDDFNVNMIYAETYQNEYKRIIRKRNGGGAWIGTGIGFAVISVVSYVFLNEMKKSPLLDT